MCVCLCYCFVFVMENCRAAPLIEGGLKLTTLGRLRHLMPRNVERSCFDLESNAIQTLLCVRLIGGDVGCTHYVINDGKYLPFSALCYL